MQRFLAGRPFGHCRVPRQSVVAGHRVSFYRQGAAVQSDLPVALTLVLFFFSRNLPSSFKAFLGDGLSPFSCPWWRFLGIQLMNSLSTRQDIYANRRPAEVGGREAHFLVTAIHLASRLSGGASAASLTSAHPPPRKLRGLYKFSQKLLGEGHVIQFDECQFPIINIIVESLRPRPPAELFLPQKRKFYRSVYGASHLDEEKNENVLPSR